MLLAREMGSPRSPAEIKRAQQEKGRCQQNSAKVDKRHGHGRGRAGQDSAVQGRAGMADRTGQGRAGTRRDRAQYGQGRDRAWTRYVRIRQGQSRAGQDRVGKGQTEAETEQR